MIYKITEDVTNQSIEEGQYTELCMVVREQNWEDRTSLKVDNEENMLWKLLKSLWL